MLLPAYCLSTLSQNFGMAICSKCITFACLCGKEKLSDLYYGCVWLLEYEQLYGSLLGEAGGGEA